MKKIENGDKVRFLSTTGSGIVTSVNKGFATVLIEDGFEIPVETSDLVVIEPQGKVNPFLRKGEFTKLEAEKEVKQEVLPLPEPILEKKKQQHVDTPDKGLYLVFVPQNQDLLIGGEIDIFLINYSTYQIAFQLQLFDNHEGFYSHATGLLEKGDAYQLGTSEHNNIKQFGKIRLQSLCFDTRNGNLFEAEINDAEIKPSRFLKEDIYVENSFFDELAFVYKIADIASSNAAAVPQKGIYQAEEKPAQEVKKGKNFLIDRYIVEPGFAEVDLHIEKLRSDHKSIRKEEMMLIQLAFFKQCLESAISKGLKKVVFIHGVGAGLLKKEIHDILNLYENLQHEDASILKYGIGATEVNLISK
ncbi:MAG: hypothetical protein CVU11_09175 [Bacteroidetes bacterium HGW-Bacteroidetes-6]|jgi:hypothetical protein|nr:MAG: hypothetical protein CVU11_09175 [Bacteroidetes bacterium HGW-Bacteroidetes-6]